jgi:hypothetical protein
MMRKKKKLKALARIKSHDTSVHNQISQQWSVENEIPKTLSITLGLIVY